MNDSRVLNVNERVNSREVVKSKRIYFFVKRMFDLLVVSVSILVLLPVFLIIVCLIKLEDGGPVFFKHKRVGQGGKVLYVYKFRSMVVNAEELLKTLSMEQLEEYYKSYKLENDFRITRVGNFIRKTSLDELPQLINILMGDMSLIGPRPVVFDELEKYGMYKERFLSVKPGLTGWWACSGRSNISYDERIELELYYVDNCSVWLDIKCFFKTIVAVLLKRGAM